MNFDTLWVGLALVLAAAVAGWVLLNRFSGNDRGSNEKLDADLNTLKASVERSLEEEAMTRRLVTGIAESLIPTLQQLNVDVKQLNPLVNELRNSMQENGATISDVMARADESGHHLARAIEELVTLRGLAEGVVLEQSKRLQAIDIALDFLSSRVQELGHTLTVPRPVETQGDASNAVEPLADAPSDEPKSNSNSAV